MSHFSRNLAVAGGMLLCMSTARAVLGGDVDSVHADRARFKGEHRQFALGQTTAHEIRMGDGSVVKQYVNAAGLVFAVSWRTRLKPDLGNLLGVHYPPADLQGSTISGVAAARREQTVRQPNLVVRRGGRMNAFAGLAYLPGAVPRGLDAETLR